MEKTHQIKSGKLRNYTLSHQDLAAIKGGEKTLQKVVDVRGMGKR